MDLVRITMAVPVLVALWGCHRLLAVVARVVVVVTAREVIKKVKVAAAAAGAAVAVVAAGVPPRKGRVLSGPGTKAVTPHG